MTVRTSAYLKAMYLEKDPYDYNNDLVDTVANTTWLQAQTKLYVSSTHASASDSNAGTDPAEPYATLDAAVSKSGLTAGDIIYLMPNHAETYTTTGVKATLDVAGVFIIGVGEGASRPTFTFSHTGATWTWSAASVTVANCLFVTGVDLVVTFATISGADAQLIDCETRDTTNKEVINDFTCTGDRLIVDGHFKNGYTSGDANVAVFTMAGVDRAEIQDCRFITKVTTGIINFTASNTAIEVHRCDFLVDSTVDFSKNVVSTAGTNTWGVWDSFDLGASATFSGGNAAAVASDDIGTVYALLTSSATSVATAVTSVGTAEQTDYGLLTSSATSVATAVTSVGTAEQTDYGLLTSSATSVTTHVTSVGTAVTSVGTAEQTDYGLLTSSATSVGTAEQTDYGLLTSSATSVTTHVTSVGTAVDSIQTNLTSSATSVGTATDSIQTNITSSATSVGTATDSVQTNLTSSATSVGTATGSIQTNLTSSATSVATGVDSVQTNLTSSATSIGTDLSSDWTSWNSRYTTDLSILRSEIDST